MARDPEGEWRLIAVLQSTVALSPALSVRLYRAAVGLHRAEAEVEELRDEGGAVGVVRRLGRELLIGAIGGPGFEAELETPQGKGFVRFLVTREGVEHAEREDERMRALQRKNWN